MYFFTKRYIRNLIYLYWNIIIIEKVSFLKNFYYYFEVMFEKYLYIGVICIKINCFNCRFFEYKVLTFLFVYSIIIMFEK